MPKIFTLIFIPSVFGIYGFSQTFRSGFDNLDYTGGGAGQNQSLFSNVASGLHNFESVALQGYLNMFKATKDKRYLDQFIVHVKRVQERRDDNIQNIAGQVKGFPADASSISCSCIMPSTSLFQINNSNYGWSYVEDPCACLISSPAVVQSGEITYPMAQFVYYMQSDPDFMQFGYAPVPLEATTVPVCGTCSPVTVATYYDFAQWLMGRIIETINFHQAEWQIDPNLNMYRYIHENLNGNCSLGRTIAMMYLVLGNSAYLQRITDIANLFTQTRNVGTVFVNNNIESYYTWNNGFSGTCREDLGHAYLVMEFAEICNRYQIRDPSGNLIFINDEMKLFANTFAYKMYKSPLSYWQSTSGDDNVCYQGGPAGYSFLAKYNPYIFQVQSDDACENAIYNNGGHLKLFSQLALLQSPDNNSNNYNNSNYKFNPIAVRRGHSPGSNIYNLASGDFDNNGMNDFISVDDADGIFYEYTPDICSNPNVGNCWVTASSNTHGNAQWKGIAGGNFDALPGDELFALNSSDGKIYFLKQNGSGFIEQNLSPSNPQTWSALTAGDFDGLPGDEAIAVSSGGNAFMIKYNNGIQQPVSLGNLSGVSQPVGITKGNFDPSVPFPQVAVADNVSGFINIFSFQNGNLL